MTGSDLEPLLPAGTYPMNAVDRAIIRLGNVLSYMFIASAIVIAYEIVARYAFNSPTKWAHETTILLGATLFSYGGSYCAACDRHIRIVLLYGAVSPKAKRRLDIVISGLCALSAATLTWAGWLVLEKAIFAPDGTFYMETSGSAWDPPFPAITKAFLFLMLAIVTLQFVLHFIGHLRRKPDA